MLTRDLLIKHRVLIMSTHQCKEWSMSCSAYLSSQLPELWIRLCTFNEDLYHFLIENTKSIIAGSLKPALKTIIKK